MKIQTILMVLVCVVLMFGGTFVCVSGDKDDDDFDDDHSMNVQPGVVTGDDGVA